jgi:hypothetical protein
MSECKSEQVNEAMVYCQVYEEACERTGYDKWCLCRQAPMEWVPPSPQPPNWLFLEESPQVFILGVGGARMCQNHLGVKTITALTPPLHQILFPTPDSNSVDLGVSPLAPEQQ